MYDENKPDMNEHPDTPKTPETPETPQTPEAPQAPQAPEAPQTPENPQVSETPEQPAEQPEQPKNPDGGLLTRIYQWPAKKWSWWNQKLWLVLAACMVLLLVSPMILTPKPQAQPAMNISVTGDRSFAETGMFTLRGFEAFKESEIEKMLSFDPPARFTVKKEGDQARITLSEARNIAYTCIVECGEKDDDDYYRRTFTINGPALTVTREPMDAYEPYQPLILTFTEQVDIDSLEKYMRITPSDPYTVEYDERMVFIYPNDGWRQHQRYTVSIDADYTSKTGKQFVNNQEFGFMIITPVPTVYFDARTRYVSHTTEDMVLPMEGSNLTEGVPVEVETYRVASLEKYSEQVDTYLDPKTPLSGLEKTDTNVFMLEDGRNRFEIPHGGEGGYILSVRYEDPHSKREVNKRVAYQVTPISVYMQASNGETAIWLNSEDAGALVGYSVAFDDEEASEGKTDANGLLIVPHNNGESRKTFKIFDPSGEVVYYDTSGLYAEERHAERFYSYLFLDRTLYKPEDTICFWGYVKPFEKNRKQLPETVTVYLDQGGLDLSYEVPINSDGTFSGEIELERIKSSQYAVSTVLHYPAEDGETAGTDRTLDVEYISVKEYQKPAYVITSVTDKEIYAFDDKVTVTATAKFYDGTPAPNFPLEVGFYDLTTWDWRSLDDVVTDDKGNATFSFPVNYGTVSSLLYSNQYVVRIASDGESITHVGDYKVFTTDIIVETEMRPQEDGKNLELVVNAYHVNLQSEELLQAIASERYYYYNSAKLIQLAKGEPADTELELSLRWGFYDKNGIRHRYLYNKYSQATWTEFANNYSFDYIVKENPKIKITSDPQTDEKIVVVATTNGTATVRDLIYLPEQRNIDFDRSLYCRANINYADSAGGLHDEYASYSNSSYSGWFDSDEENEKPVPGYSFRVTNLATGEDITPARYYYSWTNMDVDTTARFELLYDGEPVKTNGRIFYSIIMDGLYEHHFTSLNQLDMRYIKEYGLEIKLVAAYFDGKSIRYVKPVNINLNQDSMKLNIEVTPDKESYRPGDWVTLTVHATDAAGVGVAGNLCVAVVDESIFALSEQYIDVFGDLYGDYRQVNNYVSQYFTVRRGVDEYPGDGGKGGDGGTGFYDSYRSNFKDTALFLPAKTNASGYATVNFQLPDNTTSWRITAVEVGNNLKAGQSKSNIISTLPFFVRPVFTSKYIEGDEFAMLVQGHGTLLDADSEIEYTITVIGDGVEEVKTAQGKAYEPQQINFGVLPMGEYTVITRAQYSGYSDTVELPVSIIKSNLELVVNKKIDLSKPLDITAMRYPVTLTIYDRDNEAYVASLSSMFGHYCMQTSQRLSRVVAKRALQEAMPDTEVPAYIAETSNIIRDMQNEDGGIGAYLGGKSEVLLTAYVAQIEQKQFDLKAMAGYFKTALRGQKDEKLAAACQLGLAAIGESEMKVEEVREAIKGATRKDVQAYYIATLAYLGERKEATEAYDRLLSSDVSKLEERNWHSDTFEWERDAAAAWLAASVLHHPDADAYSVYFASHGWRIRTLYESMIYVLNYSKDVVPVQFSYTMSGENKTVNIGYSGLHTFVLSKSKLETLRFTDVPEGLHAVAYYTGEPSEMGFTVSENMTIEKSVTAVDDSTSEVKLTIKLTSDAPTGQYDISDWVPSNTRFYNADYEYFDARRKCTYFYTELEGQKLYVTFFRDKAEMQTIEFTYRIRHTYDSSAVLDTAYMIHGDTGENCHTEKSTFKPKK